MTNELATTQLANSCEKEDCDGTLEATVQLWFSMDADGQWYVYGVGNDCAEIYCSNDHPNTAHAAHKSLSALLERAFPGLTWTTSKPVVISGTIVRDDSPKGD